MVGVKDDGEVEGITKDPQDLIEQLSQIVYTGCSPTLIPRFYIENYEDRQVVVCEVSSGTNKPYRVKAEENGVYVRVGNTSLKANQDIVEELHWQAQGRSFDGMPNYRVLSSELVEGDILSILKRKRLPEASSIPKKLFNTMHLHHEENGSTYPTHAAVLLFHPQPQLFFSEAMTICSVFKGISGRDILSTQDMEGPLFEQLENVYEFVLKHLSYELRVNGKLNNTRSCEIPPIAIREALVNAYVHRNYHILSPVKIAIYDDRIEIFSPGEFPGPIDPENIDMGITYLRNPVLARWFRESGQMEKLGSGLPTIFKEYENAGLCRPTLREVQRNVKIILPRVPAMGLHDEDQILRYIQNDGPSGASAIHGQLMHISKATLGRKLKKMVESGVLKTQGLGKALKYYLRH
ncbi:MAG: putative DNA binding domain-containing protein [Planctomycetes bacterium]|nr:putative DNA binding domain-containing protein [Planctomycetota bacterium]